MQVVLLQIDRAGVRGLSGVVYLVQALLGKECPRRLALLASAAKRDDKFMTQALAL